MRIYTFQTTTLLPGIFLFWFGAASGELQGEIDGGGRLGAEQREGEKSIRRRVVEAVGEEAGWKGVSEEPEEEPEGLETAPLPVDMTVAAPVGRRRMSRLWTQRLEAEDPADSEDQGKLTWTQEEGEAVLVAGHVWRGWWSMGVVLPLGLTEGLRWAMGGMVPDMGAVPDTGEVMEV